MCGPPADTFLGNTVGDAIQLGQDIGESNTAGSLLGTGETALASFGTAVAEKRIDMIPNLVRTTTSVAVEVVQTPGARLALASITRTTTTQPSLAKSILGRVAGTVGSVLTGKALFDFATGAYAYKVCKEDGY